MATRPALTMSRGALAAAAAGVILAGWPGSAGAQASSTAAPLAVTATVVQTCTVEELNVPALPDASSPAGRTANTPGPSYTIRCGKQRLTYPAPSGAASKPLPKGTPVLISRSADGRTVIVQF